MATPFNALTVVVRDRVAPLVPGPGVMARVPAGMEVVTVLPLASCTVTTGWVPKAVPAALPLLGCALKASFAYAPVHLKPLLLAGAMPLLLAARGSPLPGRVMIT